jgi:hypothetical protein
MPEPAAAPGATVPGTAASGAAASRVPAPGPLPARDGAAAALNPLLGAVTTVTAHEGSVLSADVDDVDAAYALAQATGLLPGYGKRQACVADVHGAFRSGS